MKPPRPPLPSRPRAEPVTAEDRVSFVDRTGRLVVFDIPTSCALCVKCLGNAGGPCPFIQHADRRNAIEIKR